MPLDHHGKAIADIIYKCLVYDVPGTQQYLSSRLIQTSQFAQITRAPESTLKEVTEEEKEFVTSSEPQPDVTKLKTLLFDQGEREANVLVRVLDIPYIHCPER